MSKKESSNMLLSSNTVVSNSNGEYVIARFGTNSNILKPYDEFRNTIVVDEIRNYGPDPFISFTENTLNEYCDLFHPNKLDVSTRHTTNSNAKDASPLEAFLLAKFLGDNKENEVAKLVNELRLVAAYALILTIPSSGLFNNLSETCEAALTKEQKQFIVGLVNKFIKKKSGQNIKKPFECHLFNLEGGSSVVQFHGSLRLSSENNSEPSDYYYFFAVLDGFKSSEMKVFLRGVDEKNIVNKAAKTFIAEYASQLTTAAEIYIDTSLFAQVTAYSKLNSKGIKCFYIKEIVAKEKSEALKLALPNQTKHS